MQLDFEVQRSTRRCAGTDRPLEPGEVCFSVLEVRGVEIVRKDYCTAAWNGPPAESFGWWKSHVPEPNAKKIKLAPNDVLVELFEQLAGQPESDDMRYVLALLLVRRRVFRAEGATNAITQPIDAPDVDTLTVYCPKREATYEIPAVMPSNERIEEIQRQLSELLVAGGTEEDTETRRQGDTETE